MKGFRLGITVDKKHDFNFHQVVLVVAKNILWLNWPLITAGLGAVCCRKVLTTVIMLKALNVGPEIQHGYIQIFERYHSIKFPTLEGNYPSDAEYNIPPLDITYFTARLRIGK